MYLIFDASNWISASLGLRVEILGMGAGELAALEEIVGMLIAKQPQPLLRPIVVKAVAWLCDRAHQQACAQVLYEHCLVISCELDAINRAATSCGEQPASSRAAAA